MKKLIFIGVILMVINLNCDARTPSDPKTQEYLKVLNQRINQTVHIPKLRDGQKVVVQFYFDKYGKVRDINLLKSSGNKVLDTACTEAVLAIAPMAKNLLISDKEHKSEYTFNRKSLKKYPILDVDTPCIHHIPMSVLIQYPGKVDKKSLLKRENLRFFSKQVSEDQIEKLEQIYDDWAVFFNEHEDFNQKAIEKFAQKLEAKYELKK